MAVGIFVFLVLLVVKADTLSEPPAWDAAMSVHPAAITLAETGFDYPALLSMPGYADGGPNTHSLSAYTALAAAAYLLFPPTTSLIVLHLITFLFGAATASGIVRFASHFMSHRNAVITATVSLAMPVVLTQFGMVYTEAPVLAASTWAMVYAVERRWLPTAALSLLATAIKPSGAITAGALALFFLVQKGRWKNAAAILLPSAGLVALISTGSPDVTEPSLVTAAFVLYASWQFLVLVPDLLIILCVAVFAARRLVNLGRDEPQRDLGRLLQLFAVAFFAFYLTLSIAGFTTLPRYYVLIIPIAIVTIGSSILTHYGEAALTAIAIVLLAVFVANFSGDLYPRQSLSNFALIERSDAYDDLLALHQATSEAICDLGRQDRVWYSKPEMYRLRYPRLGYASCSDPGRAFPTENAVDIAALPDHLIVAYEYPRLGGATLDRLVREATASPNWLVSVERTLTSGPFTQDIYRLTRIDSG